MSDLLDAELRQRLDLVDRLLAEGRRTISTYGWCFVLWGVGHLAALAWIFLLPLPQWAWPTTMSACGAVFIALWLRARAAERVETKLGRAIGAVWISAAGAMAIAFAFDRQHPLETFFLIMGAANLTSGLSLRWGTQCAVGVLWWVAAAASLHASTGSPQGGPVQLGCFIAMAVIGEIGFGIYLMARERAERARG